jgi:crossover junction endodeoxyribonuclease RuvC
MQPKPRVILGIDPGFGRMGYGVIEILQGTVHYRIADCVETISTMPHAERLQYMWRGLNALIEKHRPDMVAVEKLFFSKNKKTALAVAETRGVILLAAQEHKIPIVEFTPLQVKVALSGYGKADKKQVAYMVVRILGLTATPLLDDTTDALAIAICAAHTNTPA